MNIFPLRPARRGSRTWPFVSIGLENLLQRASLEKNQLVVWVWDVRAPKSEQGEVLNPYTLRVGARLPYGPLSPRPDFEFGLKMMRMLPCWGNAGWVQVRKESRSDVTFGTGVGVSFTMGVSIVERGEHPEMGLFPSIQACPRIIQGSMAPGIACFRFWYGAREPPVVPCPSCL